MKFFDDYPANRLFSLDCLRGLDMFLLVVVTPIVSAADVAWGLPEPVVFHFLHTWGRFSLHDLIMPCFIFMCGAAIPFSLTRRLKDGRPTPGFWWHVLKRFALLYVLGSIVQCNLLTFDPMKIHVFYNTLQVIGVAYVTTAFVMLIPSRAVQVTIPVAMAAVMGLVVHFCGHGDYSQTGNFAYRFDRIFWGTFLPANQLSLQPNGYYCYLLPQLACNALTLCGYECALVLKGGRRPWVKVCILFTLAVSLLVFGWIISFKVPVIKHIYSLSFSLYAGGWCVIALAVLYVITDVWYFRRGLALAILFGQNALAAYMLQQMFKGGYAAAADYFTRGVPFLFGAKAQTFANGVVSAILLTLCLLGWSVWKRCRRVAEATGLSVSASTG